VDVLRKRCPFYFHQQVWGIMMNSFSFPGAGAISFGIDRVEQLGDDIFALNEKGTPVVLISDSGLAKAGILGG